jgi:hypothetical protein
VFLYALLSADGKACLHCPRWFIAHYSKTIEFRAILENVACPANGAIGFLQHHKKFTLFTPISPEPALAHSS